MNKISHILTGFWCAVSLLIVGSLWIAKANPQEAIPAYISVSGGASGEWLRIERRNLNDYEQRGFDPSYTVLLSDFRPVARQLENGQWSIHFVSELTKNQP